MKKLIAIAIVAILFTGAAMAQFSGTATATNNFKADVYCKHSVAPNAQDYFLGNVYADGNTYTLPFAGFPNNVITFTITGQSNTILGATYSIDASQTLGTAATTLLATTWDYYDYTAAAWQPMTVGSGVEVTGYKLSGTNCAAVGTIRVTATSITANTNELPGTKTFPVSVLVDLENF